MTSSPFIRVRPAGAGDNEMVRFLLAEAKQEQANYRGQFTTVVPGDHTVVAVVGESVVGVCQYLLAPQNTALVTCVHVLPQARDIGVGDALVLHVLNEMKTRGATWVSAHAQPGDRALKNLFERHGLVAQSILVGKSLSDPSTAEHASQ